MVPKPTMYINLNSFSNFSRRTLKVLVPDLAGLLGVKAGKPLVGHLIKMVYLLRGRLENSYVCIVVTFIRYLALLRKRSGTKFVVKYLKACSAILSQSIAGSSVDSAQALGAGVRLNRQGLPRIIPRVHRKFIREGSFFHIQFWLTLFSLYRPIDYLGKISLKTIFAPGPRLDTALRIEALYTFSHFLSVIGKPTEHLQSEGEITALPFWIGTTSPNSSKGEKGAKMASSALPSLLNSFVAMSRIQDKSWYRAFLEVCNWSAQSTLGTLAVASRLLKLYPGLSLRNIQDEETQIDSLGKLGLKVEPAGKVRVFAMVDAYTQWALRPLHKYLQDILRRIPMDATFNQLESVRSFRLKLSKLGVKDIFSYDLTAATDRLPIALQEVILAELISADFAIAWTRILTDRVYVLPSSTEHPGYRGTLWSELSKDSSDYLVSKINQNGKPFLWGVKYSVGQPIGALSSWTMLALTHHVIVQMAARRVGRTYFSLYLVLGDDIVIADSAVAKSYLDIMKELGCPINLSKSIISNNGSFEFAKRMIYRYQDVSPISFREMFTAAVDVRSLMALLSKVVPKFSLSMSAVLKFMDFGYKAISRSSGLFINMSRSMRRLILMLTMPKVGPFSKLNKLAEWMLTDRANHFGNLSPSESNVTWIRSMVEEHVNRIPRPNCPKTFEESVEALRTMFDDGKGSHFASNHITGVVQFLHNDLWTSYDDALIAAQECLDSGSFRDLERSSEISSIDKLEIALQLQIQAERDSQMSDDGQENYKIIDEIVTLNRLPILRKVDHVRSQYKRLILQLDSTPRKGKVRKASKNLAKRS